MSGKLFETPLEAKRLYQVIDKKHAFETNLKLSMIYIHTYPIYVTCYCSTFIII